MFAGMNINEACWSCWKIGLLCWTREISRLFPNAISCPSPGCTFWPPRYVFPDFSHIYEWPWLSKNSRKLHFLTNSEEISRFFSCWLDLFLVSNFHINSRRWLADFKSLPNLDFSHKLSSQIIFEQNQAKYFEFKISGKIRSNILDLKFRTKSSN